MGKCVISHNIEREKRCADVSCASFIKVNTHNYAACPPAPTWTEQMKAGGRTVYPCKAFPLPCSQTDCPTYADPVMCNNGKSYPNQCKAMCDSAQTCVMVNPEDATPTTQT